MISNHGYAGVRLPDGGAPDTGGQILYVNSLASSLERLGYRVTIFTRGGFPELADGRLRSDKEFLSDWVRYVFVPGGGETFVRKEDIASVLDEQLEWLDAFVRAEAAERLCDPWEVFEYLHSHYWDGAVLGVRLVERWQNDVTARALVRLLEGTVASEELERMYAERHLRALGQQPVHHLGCLLLGCEGSPATPLAQRSLAAAARWVAVRGLGAGGVTHLTSVVERALVKARPRLAPTLLPLVAADAMGVAALELVPDVAQRLSADLLRVDRHVWTPHSLGELKDDNSRDRSPQERRGWKFCERRSHERMVAERTRAFAATSPEMALWLRTHYWVPVEHIFYFPPCVEWNTFRPRSADECAATYRYLSGLSGWDEARLRSAKIVLETSRMDPTKRKDVLLAAFARVAPEVPEALLVIGGGPKNEVFAALEGRVRADPLLADRVLLAGHIPEEHIGPLFSLATLYASSSEQEGFGTSVSQAAASGLAVVASDRTPFCVQYAAESALIVPAGDEEDFALAIRRLLTDATDRARRAALLAEQVRVLDWDRQTLAFLNTLRRCGIDAAEGSNPPPKE